MGVNGDDAWARVRKAVSDDFGRDRRHRRFTDLAASAAPDAGNPLRPRVDIGDCATRLSRVGVFGIQTGQRHGVRAMPGPFDGRHDLVPA
jgi:hypothetical protein